MKDSTLYLKISSQTVHFIAVNYIALAQVGRGGNVDKNKMYSICFSYVVNVFQTIVLLFIDLVIDMATLVKRNQVKCITSQR